MTLNLAGFTGIDDPYEPPLNCEVYLFMVVDNAFSFFSCFLLEDWFFL